MTTYNTIFTALRCPDTASSIDTPQTKGEWQRFFGMMDTLERAKIVTFTKGRYELHPHQHERIAHFAEAVLDSMSLSLALPEQETEVDLSEVIYSREADAVSLYDEIKRLQEKEAALRYGLQSCLAWFRGETDYSRQTMVVFLEQFEDADNTIADALDLAMGTKQCDHCGGFGFTLDNELDNLQMAMVMDLLSEEDSPEDELQSSPLASPALDAAMQIAAELEEIKQHEARLAILESSSDDETRRAIRKEPVILKAYPRDSRYVRVDWSKRGLSSGSFELRSIIRQYERTWWVVTIWHVDKEGNPYPYDFHVAPDTVACEMVDAPKTKPSTSRVTKVLEGLPIAQAVANYGVEATKGALNEVAKRVIEQAVNAPQLQAEGV
jgi:hypothetical protein